MNTYFDCLPCLLRQAVDAVRLATDDVALQDSVLRQVITNFADINLNQPPPLTAARLQGLITEMTGNADPYKEIKKTCNTAAQQMLPELQETVRRASDPFSMAVRLAVAGNIIDFGVGRALTHEDVVETVKHARTIQLDPRVLQEFRHDIDGAERILYLGDNAGEVVFDQLLIAKLPRRKVTYVVKARPILNDATMKDAETTGMTDLVEVIDNGCRVPGTDLMSCSAEFKRRFEDADLIISKGQGNYETLNEVRGKTICFLLKVKCAMVEAHIGRPLGDVVVHRSAG